MILLNRGETQEFITVTLNEKRTLETGFYLFRFVHMTTFDEVNVIYSFLDDQSDFQDHYNQFEIDTEATFEDYPHGFWKYFVYEETVSSVDTEGLTLVERGIMKLNPLQEFEFTKYDEVTSYKVYNG